MNTRQEIDTYVNFYKSWNVGAAYKAYYDVAGNLKPGVPNTLETTKAILALIAKEVGEDVKVINRIYANINKYLAKRGALKK